MKIENERNGKTICLSQSKLENSLVRDFPAVVSQNRKKTYLIDWYSFYNSKTCELSNLEGKTG